MRTIIISIALCAAFACTKGESKSAATVEPTGQGNEPSQTEDKTAADEETEADKAMAQRIAEVRAADAEKHQEEMARWTDELHAKARELVSGEYASVEAALQAILASPHRVPGNADRDPYRHPAETLLFLGIQPTMTVVEAGAGRGWYTEILAPLLVKRGKLVVASYDPEGPDTSFRTIYGERVQRFLTKSPELFGKVEVAVIHPPEQLELGAPGSADMVLAFREMHNWYRAGYLPDYVAAVHEVLKPGGVFGVVQHRAQPGANPEDSAQKGYLPEEWLIAEVEKAGFKLEARSDVNANPKDTKDYEGGVWTLPPSLRKGDEDRAKYEAIGESDRMTLKFVKVAAPQAAASR